MRLTNSNANDDLPRWSPNGTKILFQSDRDHPDTGYMDIYVMNADGSGVIRLTTDANDNSMAAWSAEGTKIVFQSMRNGTNYQVYVMNADGSNQANLSNNSSSEGTPSFSPDGSKVVFASDRDHAGLNSIYVMNADGSNQHALTSPATNTEDTQPAWSPDGTKIAFVSTRDSTTETWQETDDDGNVINRSRLHTNKEVYVMNADGSGQTRLTNDPANDDSPSWSSLGLNIMFRSDRDRDCCDPTPQIWMMNVDGSSQTNLSFNNNGDASGSGTMIDTSDNASKDGSFITVEGSASHTIINFDNLPTNMAVTNQYPQATFSSYPGGTVSTALDCSYLGSCPNGIIATSGVGSTYWPNADLYVNFAVPVNGLTFRILGSQSGGASGIIDIFSNNAYYGSTNFFSGIGFPGQVLAPLIINLSAIQHVTSIRIRFVDNCSTDCIFRYPVYYDDFSFSPELGVTLTSSRTTGNIDGMTKNALLGADVSLTASGSISGGTYTWTYSGPVAGGQSSGASTTIHSTDTSDHSGPITATVTYKVHDIPVTAKITINSILPNLVSFTATQGPDLVTRPNLCASPEFEPPWWFYRLGCGTVSPGMHFESKVHAQDFISEPSQSGIKYVQAISVFEEYTQRGFRCVTQRPTRGQVEDGWQLDTSDPYLIRDYPVHRFNEGNDLTMPTVDAPRQPLTGAEAWEFRDNAFLDDQFIMYVVYFVGSDPGHPLVQRPIGQLKWSFGATITFEWIPSLNQGILDLHHTTTGYTQGVPTTSMVTMTGNIKPIVEKSCPDAPALTNYKIDSSRAFVRRHYLDFLGREPDDPGFDFWTSEISDCGFDSGCIHDERIHIGLAFFYSGEFIDRDPEMANPPGTPGFNPAVYNRRFVYWCYKKYLQRDPGLTQVDRDGWDFWTNGLNSGVDENNYRHTIDAFQLSDDYRNRLGNGLGPP